jgi:hypothetical protein
MRKVIIRKKIVARIVQMDGIEGFACYLSPTAKKGKTIIGLNVEALIAGIAAKDFAVKDLPYIVADSIMHEVIHVLEKWAKVQFSNRKVEKLIAAYRKHYTKAKK